MVPDRERQAREDGGMEVSNWDAATDEQLHEAMTAMDAALKQPESGFKVRIFGAMSPGTPHHEYWRRSVSNASFADILK